MSNLKFVTTAAGDWEAIYIDDTLYYEEHSIHSFQWLQCFNLGVTDALEYGVTSKYLDEMVVITPMILMIFRRRYLYDS